MKKFTLITLAVAAGCGGAPPPATVKSTAPAAVEQVAGPAAPVAAPPPPPFRLSEAAVPRHYAIDMTVVPSAETADGVVEIDLELREPSGGVWLHGGELAIKEASLTTADGPPIAARVVARAEGSREKRLLGLAFDRGVRPGPAKLRIAFTAKLQPVETLGLFKQQDRGEWYAFTQFETTDANRAFPCFDDPRWKTPWDLTLHVKQEHLALANTRQLSETPEAGGMKAVRFATTRPLPSYLVAFAVGPFGVVDAGQLRGGAPVRIITLKGDEAGARYAAQVTAPITGILEDYLGIPYPFDKLDSIAVPRTVAFSAMENPGLITYQRRAITALPEDETVRFRQRYAGTAAHEIGHMWFGDLVTLAWWDDTWLNESLASWVASIAVDKLQPGWDEPTDRLIERNRAIGRDASPTARAIRRPVESEDDMSDVFDYTAYSKGQSVLFHVQEWLGAEVFRAGVRAYLEAHAYGNARATDFYRTLGETAKLDVPAVLGSFIEQPGAPLVSVRLDCPAGGAPALALAQRRIVQAGAEAQAGKWSVPVCVRFDTGGPEAGRACTVLDGEQGSLPLPLPAGRCPAWVVPNAGGAGYYVAHAEGPLAGRLTIDPRRATRAEQVAAIGDLSLLLRSGNLPASDFLAAIARLEPSRDEFLAQATIEGLRPVTNQLVDAGQRPAWARYVQKLFGARARQLGFEGKPGEDDRTRRLRSLIVPFTATEGGDRRLAARARSLASGWLADHGSLGAETIEMVLRTTAATSTARDRQLFDRLVGELPRTADHEDRARLIGALAAVRDPALVPDALAALIAPGNDLRETWSTRELYLGGARESRRAVFDFVAAHYDEMSSRMARPARAGLLRAGALLCDPADLRRYQESFTGRAGSVLEGHTAFQDAVEAVRACIALQQAQRASLSGYLRRY